MVPKVVIVGRPNVGKSSILNMLAGRTVSIVDAIAGVTRDRVSTFVDLPADSDGRPRRFELIDTGGHGIKDSQDLTLDVEKQIARGVAEAHLILFIIDAQAGIVPLDHDVARLLRTQAGKTPVVLVANKVDGEKYIAHAQEAAALGFGEPFCLSATAGYRKHELLDLIAEGCEETVWSGDEPADLDETRSEMLLAIVGKRNAGKSTLVNALAGDERVIVSEVEGTTRDAIDVTFELEGRRFTAIDTAGVRKRKSLDGDIEYYSMHRALRAIRRADVVAFMIDAAVPVSQVDHQLANEVLRHHKPAVVVINKWDLVEDKYTREAFVEYLDDALKGLDFAPVAFLTAKRGEGVRELVAMARNLHEQAGHRVSTGELNRVMERIVSANPPRVKSGKRFKIFYVSQVEVHPPTIALVVNQPDAFEPSYERYLLNRLRDELPYSEVPIKIVVRGRSRSEVSEEGATSG